MTRSYKIVTLLAPLAQQTSNGSRRIERGKRATRTVAFESLERRDVANNRKAKPAGGSGVSTKPKNRNVYVIRLDDAVLKKKKFSDANPQYRKGRPCAYVGMTAVAPEERFEQHKRGYKSCNYVEDHGKYLMRSKFEHLNPMTYDEACRKEVELANELRKKGYAVWQK